MSYEGRDYDDEVKQPKIPLSIWVKELFFMNKLSLLYSVVVFLLAIILKFAKFDYMMKDLFVIIMLGLPFLLCLAIVFLNSSEIRSVGSDYNAYPGKQAPMQAVLRNIDVFEGHADQLMRDRVQNSVVGFKFSIKGLIFFVFAILAIII